MKRPILKDKMLKPVLDDKKFPDMKIKETEKANIEDIHRRYKIPKEYIEDDHED